MKLNKSYKTAISGACAQDIPDTWCFCGVLRWDTGAEEAEGGGIPVKKGDAADGSNLSVAEKAAYGHVAEVLPKDARIEVGASVEALSAAEAREKEGAGW